MIYFNKVKLVLLCALFALLSACSDKPQTEDQIEGLQTKFVTIGTGGASAPYNIIATSLSSVYADTYHVNSKTQTTGGSVENINLLKQNKVEMAFVMSDTLSQALEGKGAFAEPVTNLQQVASLYSNFAQIVTLKKSGINSFADLRGKRIAVGAQNSGTEVNARILLQEHGIQYQDIKVDYLSFAEAVDALKAGKLDAAFINSGLPNAPLMELSSGFEVQLVAISPEKVAEIAQKSSYFSSGIIPKGTYGNEADVPTATILNALVVRADLSDEDVYKLTKTFFDALPTLKNSHQAMSDVSLQTAQIGFVAPIHPGAKKFYDEQP